jgi:hypothetical protein
MVSTTSNARKGVEAAAFSDTPRSVKSADTQGNLTDWSEDVSIFDPSLLYYDACPDGRRNDALI